MRLKNLSMVNLVHTNFNECNLEINNDCNVLVNEFLTDKVRINVTANKRVNVLFFTSNNSKCSFDVVLEENAYLNFDLILMNDDTNNKMNFDLVGEYAELNVNILSLAKNAKKDIDINVNHLARETRSNVVNNGISFENGKNYFNVCGTIKPNMKNSDVRQITRGLILSPSGECVANPILLIDYYDVKAYHGATIGKISDDDLFYLMSRGLTKNEAFMLLINGLLEPFVKDIADEIIKEEIMKAYHAYFSGDVYE